MFVILKAAYFTGYADDDIPFEVRNNITDVIKTLEQIEENLVSWKNQMELNSDERINYAPIINRINNLSKNVLCSKNDTIAG